MKNIRLTEAQLHGIIKESVKQVLNELDPRTYASYANKRAAQANAMQDGWKKDQMMHKAADGRYAATNAWNRDFGRSNTSYNGFGDTSNSQAYMQNDDYTVHENDWDINNDGSRNYMTRQYDPKTNQVQYDHQRYDSYGRNTFNQQGTQDSTSYYDKGRRVARQMANGNGNYIKGKGWQ